MNKSEIITEIRKRVNSNTITRKELVAVCKELNLKWPSWLANDKKYRVDRGVYSLDTTNDEATEMKLLPLSIESQSVLGSPEVDPLYIRTGNYSTIVKVIESEMFYPVYITGLSGNGKTMGVEQACANLSRPLVRVNLTSETEEDDLLGGFRLIQGETRWFDGPVVLAMKQGAILLLDEVDLASTKIMCLQPVLEGRGIFLKKIGKYVTPAKGFNVFATANTKGQGDENGKFIGTNVLNEAFMERFPLWLEQDYPTPSQELRILKKVVKSLNLKLEENTDVPNLAETLIEWAHDIRKGYHNQVHSEIVTTRRLVQILKAYKILNDARQAVKMCLNRFNLETQESFYTLFVQFIKVSIVNETGELVSAIMQNPIEDVDPSSIF